MKNTDTEKDLFDDDFEIIYEYLDDSDTDSEIEPEKPRKQKPARPAADAAPPKKVQSRPPQKQSSRPVSQQKSAAVEKTAAPARKSSAKRPSAAGKSSPARSSASEKKATPVRKASSVKASAPADDQKKNKRRKKKKSVNLLSPAMNTAKAGGKAVYKIAGFLLRYGSMILIGYIIYLTGSRLWNGRTAYGDLYLLLKQRNYILGAYSATTVVLLLYELISLLWAFSGPKTREGRKVEKIDTGRGFLFFLIIAAGSFASAAFSSMIPSSPSFLQGISGALGIYGSLSAALLPVCVVGAVLCLVRKFITK